MRHGVARVGWCEVIAGLPDISWEKKPNHIWKKAKPGEKKPNCQINMKFEIIYYL